MRYHPLLLWTGRIAGSLVTLFFLSFLVGEGGPDIIKGRGWSLLGFLPFMIPSFAGFILSWWRPLAGGRLLLAGAFLLTVYFVFFEDYSMLLFYALPSAAVGLCLMAAANRKLI